MLEHTERALRGADVVLFMIDGREGVTEEDERFVRWVKERRRSHHAPGALGSMYLVANKTEALMPSGEALDDLVNSCYKLGLGEPTLVSAEHGEGLGGLYSILEPHALQPLPPPSLEGQEEHHRLDGQQRSSALAPPPPAAAAAAAAVAVVARKPTITTTLTAASTSTPPPSLPGAGKAAFLSPRVLSRLSRDASGEVAIAVVGRPNVGKSTLVNALLGRERSLVGPTPGLTRDAVTSSLELTDPSWVLNGGEGGGGFPLQGETIITAPPHCSTTTKGRRVRIVDTAGMRRSGTMDLSTPLEGLAVGQSRKALALAHVVVLVVDGSGGTAEGLTEEPQTFPNPPPSSSSSSSAAGGGAYASDAALARRFGKSGGGGGGGGDDTRRFNTARSPRLSSAREIGEEAEALVREAAALAPPKPTPPLLPRQTPLAHASRASSQGLEGRPFGLTKGDLAIAAQVLEEGRGLVVALNKLDAAGGAGVAGEVAKIVAGQLEALGGGVLVPTCALRGVGVGRLLDAIFRTHASWSSRASTGRLNAWLSLVMRHHPPPSISVSRRGGGFARRKSSSGGGEYYSTLIPLRVKYVAQVNSRPPTFAAFTNHAPSKVPTSYKNFLVNSLRAEFNLVGVPVRLLLRRRDNPFSKRTLPSVAPWRPPTSGGAPKSLAATLPKGLRRVGGRVGGGTVAGVGSSPSSAFRSSSAPRSAPKAKVGRVSLKSRRKGVKSSARKEKLGRARMSQ